MLSPHSRFLIGFAGLAVCMSSFTADTLWGRQAVEQATAPAITVANYELAEARMRHNIFPKVKNLFVVPRWIGQTDHFVYGRQTESGHEFVIVDAATGEKKPAFDHPRLGELLTPLGVTSPPTALPLRELQFDDDLKLKSFKIAGDVYEVDWTAGNVTKIPAVAKPGEIVSPDKKFAMRTTAGNLWLRNLETNAEIQLTQDGSEDDGYGVYYGNWKAAHIPRARSGQDHPPMECRWSPDSRYILAVRLDQRHVQPYPFLETAPHDGTFRPKLHMPRIPLTGEEPAKAEWYVLDIEKQTKHRVQLPYEKLFHVHQDMLAIRKVQWSGDGQRLFATTWGDNLSSAQIFEVELSSGSARPMVEESMAPRMDTNSTSYNPPNVHVTSDGQDAIWFSQRDGWGHLYWYDSGRGILKTQITEGQWLVRDLIHVDEANRWIYFTACGLEQGNPYYRYLYKVRFDGTEMKLLTPEKADHMLTGQDNDVLAIDGAQGYQVVSPSGQYVVYNYSTIHEPTKTAIRRTSDGSLISELEQADASALYESGWEDAEEFVATAADGQTKLYGVLYKPHDFDPELRYPVIDSQYASPLTAVVPRNFMMALVGVPSFQHPASLAALGFVVVSVDARGTTFRSKEFSHYSHLNLNTIGLEDHVAVIKELAQSRPWMDIDRVGIEGGSYGGFTVFRAMFEFPEFYKVGISGAGVGSIHNMYPDYHWEAYHGRVVYSDGSARRPTPSERPTNYRNNDATVQAKNLQGKLLIMLGEIDENVLPATTLQVIDSLIKLDKDFDMLYVPNRPHNFASRHVMRRGLDYLVHHLHGIEPPDYEIKSLETPEEQRFRESLNDDPEKK